MIRFTLLLLGLIYFFNIQLLFHCQVCLFTSASETMSKFSNSKNKVLDLKKILQDTLVNHKQGNFEDAIEGYETLISSFRTRNIEQDRPTLLTLYSNLGALYMSLGQYDDAERKFSDAIEYFPSHSNSHFNLAVLLTSKLNKHPQALKHCSLAIKYSPDETVNRKYYHLMGNIMQNLGKLDQAERYFQLAEDSSQEGHSSNAFSSDQTFQLKQYYKRYLNDFEVEFEEKVYHVQVVSQHPIILTIDHFLDEEESQYIREKASLSLEKSFVMGSSVKRIDNEETDLKLSSIESSPLGETNNILEDPDLYRSSYNTWLPQDALLQKIQARISKVLDLPLAYIRQKSEDLQVVKYQLGGQFKAHQDASAFHSRFFTSLFYLNTASIDTNGKFHGGETWFPFSDPNISVKTVDEAVLKALNIFEDTDSSKGFDSLSGSKVASQQGKAAIFFNYDENGNLDPRAVHAGLPIRPLEPLINLDQKLPEKWIANYWVDLDLHLLQDMKTLK